MHIPLTGEDLDIYLRIEVTIVYKIVNMDLTQNFFAMLSCKAAVQEKKLHYI